MPIFNYKSKELIAKIVYYGPGLCGKTTSIQQLHQQTIPERKGELYFLATETDQTIYFELLPLYVGEIQDFKLRLQVYTVPGQVKYNHTRKIVLQGVDAIVFVADSQKSRREANLMSLDNLKYNLKGGYNVLLENVPLVYEYNKRDLWDLLSVEDLNRDLNPRGLPYFEAIATKGKGVVESFEAISSMAIKSLEKQLLRLDAKAPAVIRGFEKRQAPAPPMSQQSEGVKEYEETPLEGKIQIEALDTSIFDQPLNFGEEEVQEILPVGDEQEDLQEDLIVSAEKAEPEKRLSYLDIISETYHNGEIIFEEGDPGDKMYFIEHGKVKIVGSYKDTKKVLITYEQGDFFGEMVLFGGTTRSARAVAIGTTRLVTVTKETLASQIKRKPEIALGLLKALASRIRNDTKTINKLAEQNKELFQRLKKAHDTMGQLIEQNKSLKQEKNEE
jgi:CRP-like cAMP-binding protein/signal recognition particle receptor subunit beta